MARLPAAEKLAQQKKKDEAKLYCLRCGNDTVGDFYRSYDDDRKYFEKIPYCKTCIKAMYERYLKKYKNNINLAVYYLCRKLDIPYVHSNYIGALTSTKKEGSAYYGIENIVSAYMKGFSFGRTNGWGSSFDDSEGENQIEGLVGYDSVVKIKRNIEDKKVDSQYEVIEYDADDLVIKWGQYDNPDLAFLESEYLDWEDKLGGITDKSVEMFVKEICLQYLCIRKGREQGRSVDKELKSLQDLLKTSGLIELQANNQQSISIGMTAKEIEFHRPIKTVDPELADVDNIQTLLYGYLGGISSALGKKNAYTEKFNDLYGEYSIDIISDLETQHKQANMDEEKTHEPMLVGGGEFVDNNSSS